MVFQFLPKQESKMKEINQELDYYERFWKRELKGKSPFHGLPDWRENLKKRLDFFKETTKDKILDAGCGEGHFVMTISQLPNVEEVHGVDISKRIISECKKKAKKNKFYSKVKFHIGSVTN